MSILKSAPNHSTKLFTFEKNSNSFIAEESDFGKSKYFGKIYDDACDEGFWLTSHKTGAEKAFALHRTHRNNDGELTHYEYREIDQRTGRIKADALKVIIFND